MRYLYRGTFMAGGPGQPVNKGRLDDGFPGEPEMRVRIVRAVLSMP
jgi:hypothetical protein